MAVPDDFDFFYLGLYTLYINFTVNMLFFNLHHSGTQFSLGYVDIVFDPKIRQLHSPRGLLFKGRGTPILAMSVQILTTFASKISK